MHLYLSLRVKLAKIMDVNVQTLKNKFVTYVYTKETNDGSLFNYDSECPSRYKFKSIVTLLNRALKISSDWQIFNNKINRLKQIFINNNFPMKYLIIV